jgi:hypothetical protein
MRAQPLLLACRGRVFLHAFSARVLMNFHIAQMTLADGQTAKK